jgi:Spy/CpxP family protein refolding chaperone
MKAKLFSVIVIALVLSGTMFGQPGQDTGKKQGTMAGQPGRCADKDHKPNFTEEQKTKMKEIRMASYKEIKPLKNQLGELKAKQRTLATADKPDINAINANIDEITKVENKIMKIKASGHQQVRVLLTDEQKMWFDSREDHDGGKMGKKMHRGGGDAGFQRGSHGPEHSNPEFSKEENS